MFDIMMIGNEPSKENMLRSKKNVNSSFNVTPSSISLNEHGGSVNILKPTPHYNRALHV